MKTIKKAILMATTLLLLLITISSAAATDDVNQSSDNLTALSNTNATVSENTSAGTLSNTTTNSSNQTDESNTVISGTVTECQGTDPFAGATIKVESLSGVLLATTQSGADGKYSLSFFSNENTFKVTSIATGHVFPSQLVTVTPSASNSTRYGFADLKMGTLQLTKGSWDIIGLDSNNVNVGPNQSLIQIHVTNNAAVTATNVQAVLTWNTANAYVDIATGESLTKNLGDIPAGATVDVFYLINIVRNANAYFTSRAYTIQVYGDNTGTPIDNITGNLYVEKLVSQNRNQVNSIVASTNNPTLGDTFAVTVSSHTAASNYDVVNLPVVNYDPTKIQPVSVTVSYGATTSNNVRLDAPGATDFISVWIFKAVGAGTTNLLAYITDQSGSSYHYNGDYGDNINVQVVPRADLAVTKSVSPSSDIVPFLAVFTITATNYGPNNATGVVVTDLLPAGLTFVSANPSTGTYDEITGLWTIGNLNVGVIETLTINVMVNVAGQITNVASIDGNEEDPDRTNNQDIAVINAEQPNADLGVTKTVNNSTTNVGEMVTFTITVRNAGPDDATGVTVTDTWPSAGFNLLSANPSQGTFSLTGPNLYTWNVGSLVHQATATLTIIAQALQTGTFTNNVTVTGDQNDPHPEDNTDEVDVTVDPSIDLAVVKSVNNATPNVGQNVVFTISVTNNGPNNATGVIVNDLLPVGLTYVSSTTTQGTYNSGTGIWTVGNLNVGVTRTLTITARVTALGGITNIASATGNEFDHNLNNNEDAASINSDPTADLRLVKTVDNTMPYVGENVVFLLTLTNNGPNDATNVVVDDVLPAGLSLVNYVASQGTYDGSVWTVGSLAHEATATLKILATVLQTGFITNIGTASATEFDPDTSDNTDAETIDAQPSADLEVVKTVNPTTQNVGDDVTFTISATNNGPNNATGVVVNDLLPAGLTFVSANPSTGTYDDATGLWTIGNLNVGVTETLQIIATVIQTGQINNFATISGNEHDPDLTNNQDIAVINGVPTADLFIKKDVCDCIPYVGQTIRFTVTLTNAGPNTATNVRVTDTWPSGLQLVSAIPSKGSFTLIAPNTYLWDGFDLDHDETATLAINATVLTVGEHTNVVNTTSDVYDPHTEDNRSSITINGQPSADVEVNKSVNPTTQNYGQNITYTITVTNNGPNTATGVTVDDLIQAGALIFVSANPSQGTYNPVNGVWTIGTLINGQSEVLDIVYKVNATGTILNQATKSHQNEFDPDTANDSDNGTLEVPPAAALYLVVNTTTQCIRIGNNVLIQFKLGNNGPDTSENVVVTWVVPQGMEFVSATPQSGYGTATYDAATRTLTWYVGDVPVIDPYLDIIVALLTPGKYLINPAVASTTYNPTPTNITPADVCAITNETNGTTGNGIPMQPTGMPLAPFILGILAIVAGFLVPEKIRRN